MFRDVPECSGIFHVPGFIDGQFKTCCKTLVTFSRLKSLLVKTHTRHYRNGVG